MNFVNYLDIILTMINIGCTSGHGISGLPSLHVISWITMTSMAVGAMSTGALLSNLVITRSEYLLQN